MDRRNITIYLSVALGGFMGAGMRLLLKEYIFPLQAHQFPFAILFANLLGTFVLAAVLTLAVSRFKIQEGVFYGITSGFCGALTTFSTFQNDLFKQVKNDQVILAMVYGSLSLLLGFLVVKGTKHLVTKGVVVQSKRK